MLSIVNARAPHKAGWPIMIDLTSFIIYTNVGQPRIYPAILICCENGSRVRYSRSRLYIPGTRAGRNISIYSFNTQLIIATQLCGVRGHMYDNVTHCTTHPSM
jgi:hypothetical protein